MLFSIFSFRNSRKPISTLVRSSSLVENLVQNTQTETSSSDSDEDGPSPPKLCMYDHSPVPPIERPTLEAFPAPGQQKVPEGAIVTITSPNSSSFDNSESTLEVTDTNHPTPAENVTFSSKNISETVKVRG